MTGDKDNPRMKAQAKSATGSGGAEPAGRGDIPARTAEPAGAPAAASAPAAPEQEGWSEKRIFTTGEAAEVCKVSQQTIIRCFDSGRLGGFRVPGSKFRRIPRADLIKFMRDNEIPIDSLEGKASKRILVVDDDEAILEVFQDLIGKDARFELRTCGTGYEAGMLTESFRPHVLVLDYMLPDLNGNEVCLRIRERDELAGTRIVFVSGVVGQEEIDKLMAAGADEFVRKPFDTRHIMARIAALAGV